MPSTRLRSYPWSAAVATGVPLEGGLGHVVTLLPVRDLTTGLSRLCTMGRRRVQTPGRSAHFDTFFFFQNRPESVSAAAENVAWRGNGPRVAPPGDLRGGAPGRDRG